MQCTYSRAKYQDRIERHVGQGGLVLQVLVIILVIAEERWNNNQVGALYTDMVRWCRMSDAEDDYDAADAGAADCTPIEAGAARKGGFLVIKGRPCKIVDVSKAKVGKHGAAKCHFIGIDIFTAKKLECICPASAGLSQPIVERIEYQLCDIADDGYLSLMTGGGDMRDDIKVTSILSYHCFYTVL